MVATDVASRGIGMIDTSFSLSPSVLLSSLLVFPKSAFTLARGLRPWFADHALALRAYITTSRAVLFRQRYFHLDPWRFARAKFASSYRRFSALHSLFVPCIRRGVIQHFITRDVDPSQRNPKDSSWTRRCFCGP